MSKLSTHKWSISDIDEILPVSKVTINKAIENNQIKPLGKVRGRNPYESYDPKAVIKAVMDGQTQKAVEKLAPVSTGAETDEDGNDLLHYKTQLTKEQAEGMKIKNDLANGIYIHTQQVAKGILLLQKGLVDVVDEICTGITQLMPNERPELVELINQYRAVGKNLVADFRLKD